MKRIEGVAEVGDDGRVRVERPADLPPGRHKVVFLVEEPARTQPLDEFLEEIAFDFGPWPDSLSLRREDLYGDWGR